MDCGLYEYLLSANRAVRPLLSAHHVTYREGAQAATIPSAGVTNCRTPLKRCSLQAVLHRRKGRSATRPCNMSSVQAAKMFRQWAGSAPRTSSSGR
ncbi:MAG: hypothetical protein U0694_15745 [Anaerolineae bacterium]